jgi:hypothetical protein
MTTQASHTPARLGRGATFHPLTVAAVDRLYGLAPLTASVAAFAAFAVNCA